MITPKSLDMRFEAVSNVKKLRPRKKTSSFRKRASNSCSETGDKCNNSEPADCSVSLKTLSEKSKFSFEDSSPEVKALATKKTLLRGTEELDS